MTTLKMFATAAALLAASGTAAAQQGTVAVQPASGTAVPACSMMNAGGGDMTAHHQQLMANMRDADRKLDELVVLMNAAQGQDRLDRVADVVKELVTARRQMADGMTMMMMSGSRPMGSMMPGCSMMKPAIPATDDKKDGGDDDHSAHHPVQQ